MQGGHGDPAAIDSEDLKSQVPAPPPLNGVRQGIKDRLDELDTKEREICLERLELKSGWNRSLMVTQLPNEILVLIFIYSSALLPSAIDEVDVDYFKFAPAKEQWMKLMLVCRCWCDIVRATPALWRTIDVGKKTDWMKLALARSGNATIDASFSSDFHQEHAALLGPHYHRLRSLRLRWCSPAAHPVIHDSKLPVLESLEIPSNPQSTFHRRGIYVLTDLAITRERFPNLRVLQVARTSIPTDPLLYTRLCRLSLTGCPFKSSLEQFVQLLADSPGLRHLELDDFLQQLDGAGNVGPPRLLLSLRSLRLSNHLPMYSAQFLARVIIPAASLSITVNVADYGDDDGEQWKDDSLCATVPPDLRSSFPQLPTITWAKLSVIYEGCIFECHSTIPEPGETSLVELSLVGRNWEGCLSEAMADFVAIFGSASLAHLETVGYSETIADGTGSWTRLFRTFPSLLSLDAYIVDAVIEGFLEASLSSPDVDELIVCRGLERITLNDEWGDLRLTIVENTFDTLLRSLLCRADRGFRLKELRLELSREVQAAVRDRYLSQLEDVVSDVVFGNAFAENKPRRLYY